MLEVDRTKVKVYMNEVDCIRIKLNALYAQREQEEQFDDSHEKHMILNSINFAINQIEDILTYINIIKEN